MLKSTLKDKDFHKNFHHALWTHVILKFIFVYPAKCINSESGERERELSSPVKSNFEFDVLKLLYFKQERGLAVAVATVERKLLLTGLNYLH